MSEFPSDIYSNAQQKWLGRDHLVTPSIRKAIGEEMKGKKVLDVGCGNGHYSFDFLTWGATSVIGIDNSADMISQCNLSNTSNAQNVQFQLQDITNFDLHQKFDIACAFFVLQFIHEKPQLQQAIQNIAHHLNRDGLFFAFVPNGVNGVVSPKGLGEKFGAAIDKRSEVLVDGELVDVNFYENGAICGSAKVALHSREFYEDSLKSAGFGQIEWISPTFSDYGRQVVGEEMCEKYLNPPVDILFKCRKMEN